MTVSYVYMNRVYLLVCFSLGWVERGEPAPCWETLKQGKKALLWGSFITLLYSPQRRGSFSLEKETVFLFFFSKLAINAWLLGILHVCACACVWRRMWDGGNINSSDWILCTDWVLPLQFFLFSSMSHSLMSEDPTMGCSGIHQSAHSTYSRPVLPLYSVTSHLSSTHLPFCKKWIEIPHPQSLYRCNVYHDFFPFGHSCPKNLLSSKFDFVIFLIHLCKSKELTH